ncbi:hypothetical protein [Bradyrhizobium sp. USDA 3315]
METIEALDVSLDFELASRQLDLLTRSLVSVISTRDPLFNLRGRSLPLPRPPAGRTEADWRPAEPAVGGQRSHLRREDHQNSLESRSCESPSGSRRASTRWRSRAVHGLTESGGIPDFGRI